VNVGDRVRIERDETRYPSKGTWPQFRGKTGTIVEINLGEYGVCFGKVWPRPDRPGVYRWGGDDSPTWFQPYELRVLTPGYVKPVQKPVAVAEAPQRDPERVPAGVGGVR
jgi:hypothetical protein